MQKKHLATFALAALAGPWVAAQTLQSGPPPPDAPAATPGAVRKPTAPLDNPLNRNPARRAQVPVKTAPAPPDPRDSSTRPVQPPSSFDQRDTVVQPPELPSSAARRP